MNYLNNNLYLRIILSLFIFIFSLYILPYYQFGDQASYRFFYAYVGDLDTLEWYLYWSEYTISTTEPVYVFLSWLCSKVGISKDIYISLCNAIFVYFLINAMQLKKYNMHIIIIIIIVLNYYFLVLYFAAERLKFAILFVLLYMLNSDKKYKDSFIFLAILSHSQILIGYLSYLFKELITNYKKLNIKLIFVLSILVILLLGKHILGKILFYISFDNDILELNKIALFFILALYYSQNKKETVLLFIPLSIAILFLSGDRLNIFGYFIFLYYALQVNRGINLGIISTSLYFSYKSILLLQNIIVHGDGFYK